MWFGAVYHVISRGNIHLNPVRAKMAARPEEYRWSSYRGYVRARRAVPWIVQDKVLGEFGRDLSTARRAYGRFVRAGVDEPPPSPFGKAIGGLLLGSEKFVRRIQRLIDARPADAELPETKLLRSRPSLERILEAVADHFGNEPRRWPAGRRSDDASRAAAALGYRDASGVSHAIKRIEAGTGDLRRSLARLERSLDYSLFKI